MRRVLCTAELVMIYACINMCTNALIRIYIYIHVCDPSIQEAEAGGLLIEASLGYIVNSSSSKAIMPFTFAFNVCDIQLK